MKILKKNKLYLTGALILLFLYPLKSNAQSNDSTISASTTFNVSVPPETETEIERNRIKAQILLIRLDEINARDKSEMNFADKRKMRKEVRSIRWELNRIGGGVYISAGAIIIIVILLVIFL